MEDPEGYAAARELALGDVGPSGSGETTFHTAMAADSNDLPSTVEAGTYDANASQQSGLWDSEDFKSGALHTDTSDAHSCSPTSTLTLQACSAVARHVRASPAEHHFRTSALSVLFTLSTNLGSSTLWA